MGRLRVLLSLALLAAPCAADGPAKAPAPSGAEIGGLRLAILAASEMRRRHGPEAKETLRALAAAEQAFREALGRSPDDPDLLVAYGLFLAESGQDEMAKAHWERAMALDGARTDGALLLADYHLKLGNILQATKHLAAAVARPPARAEPHFELATVQFLFRHELAAAEGRTAADILQDAVANFRVARDLEPLNHEYGVAYAEAFYLLEPPRWEEARAAWEALLNIAPDKEFVYLHLARVAVRQGDGEAARRYLASVTDPKRQRTAEKVRAQADRLPAAPQTP